MKGEGGKIKKEREMEERESGRWEREGEKQQRKIFTLDLIR